MALNNYHVTKLNYIGICQVQVYGANISFENTVKDIYGVALNEISNGQTTLVYTVDNSKKSWLSVSLEVINKAQLLSAAHKSPTGATTMFM